MLHLWLTFDNFADIFPICLNLIFYISKVTVSTLYVVLFYKFDYLEQYLRESFNTTSGFHFETKSPISSSCGFYLLIQLNEKFKTPFFQKSL